VHLKSLQKRRKDLVFNNIEWPVQANVYVGPFTAHIGFSNNWYLKTFALNERKFEGVDGSFDSRTRIDERITGYDFQIFFGGGYKMEIFDLHVTPYFQYRLGTESISNVLDGPNLYTNNMFFGCKVGYPLNLNF
jgi:hypothetical protein